jgi:uncharacterized cysteine cluster protein YcgN (CxxCxxCC family)
VSGRPFWKDKSLSEMSTDEWESLCDRCGKCCVLKIEDADTGEVHYTDVACKLLHCGTALPWMPQTCAYRVLHEGGELAAWHPLVSGDPDSPRQAGISVAGRVFPEESVPLTDLIDHITTW